MSYILGKLLDPGGLTAILAGMVGGVVSMLRGAPLRDSPLRVPQIASFIFIAAFTSWLVSLILSPDMSENYRAFILVVAGMVADQLLTAIEKNLLHKLTSVVREVDR